MGFCKTILFLLFCCIYPLMGIIWPIITLLRPKPILSTCTISNKSYTNYSVTGEYGRELAQKCGPTINYQLMVHAIIHNNVSVTICGVERYLCDCCNNDRCIEIEKDFFEFCPPLIQKNLDLYNSLIIGNETNCYLYNDEKVTLEIYEQPLGLLLTFLIICGLWLLFLTYLILNTIYKECFPLCQRRDNEIELMLV